MSSLLPDSAKYDLNCQLQACQSSSRRNGKVARLPAHLRNQINRMIQDGIPYKAIIKSLGDPGRHLNEDNLSNWRLGGYQDYLKAHIISERARGQIEAAADLVRQDGHLDLVQLKQTASELVLLNYIDTIMQHGTQLTADSLKKNPAKFITLVNACCNLSDATLAIENRKMKSPAPPR